MPIRTGADRPGSRVSGPSKADPDKKTHPASRIESSSAVASIRGHGITDTVQARGAPSPEKVATEFYDAFTHRRFDDLAKHYAPDVRFKDPIFDYRGRDKTMNMWRKLLARDPDARFQYSLQRVEGNVATGRWVADYKLDGRPVHNEVTSRLTVRDGKIIEHRDDFDFGKWLRQVNPKLGRAADLKPVQLAFRTVFRTRMNDPTAR